MSSAPTINIPLDDTSSTLSVTPVIPSSSAATPSSSSAAGGGGGARTVESRLPPTVPNVQSSGSNTPLTLRSHTFHRKDSRQLSGVPTIPPPEDGAIRQQSGSGLGTTITLQQFDGTMTSLAAQAAAAHEANASSNSDGTSGAEGNSAVSFGFERTLPSEMEISEVFEHLISIESATHLFAEWSLSDLQILSQLLTVLKFQAGENVIEVGESSSFVAILLTGSLEVQLPDNGSAPTRPPISMTAGSLIGELSVFQGGTRSANVKAVTDAGLAIITFSELEALKQIVPDIRMKLMCLFAMEGLKKLRKVLDTNTAIAGKLVPTETNVKPPVAVPTPPPGSLSTAAAETGSLRKPSAVSSSQPGSRSESPAPGSKPPTGLSVTASATNPPTPNNNTAAASTPLNATAPIAPSARRTTNRRATMQSFASSSLNFFNSSQLKSEAAPANNALSPSNAASAAVAASPRRVEAMFRKRGVETAPSPTPTASSSTIPADALADALSAAKKAEKHKIQTIQLVVSSQEKQLSIKKQQIENLTTDLKNMSDARKEQEKLLTRVQATNKKLVTERDQLQAALSKSIAGEELLKRTVTALEEQVKGNIDSAIAFQQERIAAIQAELDAETLAKLNLEALCKQTKEERQALFIEFGQYKLKSEKDLTAMTKRAEETYQRALNSEAELLAWKARVSELQQQINGYTISQREVETQAEESRLAKTQAHRLFTTTADRLAILNKDYHAYRKLLRRALVAIFVRSFKQRQQLYFMQKQLGAIQTALQGTIKADQSLKHTNSSAGDENLMQEADGSLDAATAAAAAAVIANGSFDPNNMAMLYTDGGVNADAAVGVGAEISPTSAAAAELNAQDSSQPVTYVNSAWPSSTKRNKEASKQRVRQTTSELVASCSDTVALVGPMVKELCRLKSYWNEMSNSNWKRTIELQEKNMELQADMQKEHKKYVTAKKTIEQLNENLDAALNQQGSTHHHQVHHGHGGSPMVHHHAHSTGGITPGGGYGRSNSNASSRSTSRRGTLVSPSNVGGLLGRSENKRRSVIVTRSGESGNSSPHEPRTPHFTFPATPAQNAAQPSAATHQHSYSAGTTPVLQPAQPPSGVMVAPIATPGSDSHSRPSSSSSAYSATPQTERRLREHLKLQQHPAIEEASNPALEMSTPIMQSRQSNKRSSNRKSQEFETYNLSAGDYSSPNPGLSIPQHHHSIQNTPTIAENSSSGENHLPLPPPSFADGQAVDGVLIPPPSVATAADEFNSASSPRSPRSPRSQRARLEEALQRKSRRSTLEEQPQQRQQQPEQMSKDEETKEEHVLTAPEQVTTFPPIADATPFDPLADAMTQSDPLAEMEASRQNGSAKSSGSVQPLPRLVGVSANGNRRRQGQAPGSQTERYARGSQRVEVRTEREYRQLKLNASRKQLDENAPALTESEAKSSPANTTSKGASGHVPLVYSNSVANISPYQSHSTYSQLSLHSPSPYVSTHIVHGVLSSASKIYSTSSSSRKRAKVREKRLKMRSSSSPTRSPLRGSKGLDQSEQKQQLESPPLSPKGQQQRQPVPPSQPRPRQN